MMRMRVQLAVWLAVVVLALVAVGCQMRGGAQPAATPRPPATPLPPNTPVALSVATPVAAERQYPMRRLITGDTKVIEGYLSVEYFPLCEPVPRPALWVAPIKLTDLRSGSYVYLNRDGTAKASPKPVYLTEEGREAIEAALMDDSVLERIVTQPDCPY